jgi:hypothetical protein
MDINLALRTKGGGGGGEAAGGGGRRGDGGGQGGCEGGYPIFDALSN